MNTILAPFIGIYDVIKWLLVHLASAFSTNHLLLTIGPFGLAIVLVTLAIRGVLFPLYRWQYTSQQKMMADQNILQPMMSDLRKKYKKDPQKLNIEMQKMYKDIGISPYSGLSGCLPMLIQLPILFAVYDAIKSATQNAKGNTNFLWIPNVSKSIIGSLNTAKHAPISTVIGDLFKYLGTHPALMLLPIVAAILTFMQFQMIMQPPVLEQSAQQKQMQGVQKNTSVLSSVLFLYLGVSFAQGLAIYWVVQSIFAIVQQFVVMGWGGLSVPEWTPGWKRTQRLLLEREERVLARVKMHKQKLSALSPALDPGKGKSGGGGKGKK